MNIFCKVLLCNIIAVASVCCMDHEGASKLGGTLIAEHEHSQTSCILTYSPNPAVPLFAASGADGSVSVFDERGVCRYIRAIESPVTAMRFSPDGSEIALGIVDGNGAMAITTIDSQAGMEKMKVVLEKDCQCAVVSDIAYSPDGFMGSGVSSAGSFYLWAHQSGYAIEKQEKKDMTLQCARFLDLNTLILLAKNGNMYKKSLTTRHLMAWCHLKTRMLGAPQEGALVDDTGQHIIAMFNKMRTQPIAGFVDNKLNAVAKIPKIDCMSAGTCTAEGKIFFAANGNTITRLIYQQQQRPEILLATWPQLSRVSSMSCSPDASVLVTSALPHTISVWQINNN